MHGELREPREATTHLLGGDRMAATPKTFTDGSSDVDEANLNLFVRGGKLQVKVNYCRVLFTAATNTPTVDTGDSDGEIVTGDLSWSATEIEVVLSGFSTAPIAIAVIESNSSTNVEAVLPRLASSSLMSLRFVSGAGQVAVDPDGDVKVNLLVIGA